MNLKKPDKSAYDGSNKPVILAAFQVHPPSAP